MVGFIRRDILKKPRKTFDIVHVVVSYTSIIRYTFNSPSLNPDITYHHLLRAQSSHTHTYTHTSHYSPVGSFHGLSRVLDCFWRVSFHLFISAICLIIYASYERSLAADVHNLISLSSLAFLFSSLFLSQPSFTHSVLGWMRFTVT